MSKFIKRIVNPKEYQAEKLQNTIIDLKMSKKNLERQGAKLEKNAAASKTKIKNSLKKGDLGTAKIHAESAVRNASAARSFYRMAGKVDAVCDRMKEALAAQRLNSSMTKVVQGLAKALATMTPENMASKLADFEELDETIGVNIDFMDMSIGTASKATTGQDEVQAMLDETADVLGIENTADMESTAGLPVPLSAKNKNAEAGREGAEGLQV